MTCDLSGFGPDGKVSFDWKHFTYEDYDEWLFGENGRWNANSTMRRPDVFVFEFGIHTCMHSYANGVMNQTTIDRHEKELPIFMKAVKTAVDRHSTLSGGKTMVIASTAGENEWVKTEIGIMNI